MADVTETKTVDGDEPSKSTKRGVRPPILKIVLDTNQLYTSGSASDLLNLALREVIEGSRQHHDLLIEWFVPEMVRWEREYQMIEAANGLLPGLLKLERLLGHKLGFNTEILIERVRAVIEKQFQELALKPLTLKTSDVDWRKMTMDAVFRQPPFEKGKTEKGFRDAVIAESFMQLVASSPKTRGICRVALASADSLLATAVTDRTASLHNVRILSSVEEIQGLINTLVSTTTEEFVESIKKQAEKYFFSSEDKAGVYFTENVRERIREQHGASLLALPPAADSRENGTWRINAPSFVKKKGQRITWRTTIRVDATAYKSEPSAAFEPQIKLLGVGPQSDPGGVITSRSSVPISNYYLSPSLDTVNYGRYGLQGLGFQGAFELPKAEKSVVAKGETIFHVMWSVTVTSNKKLTAPKIERVDFAETVWQ